MSYKRLGWWVVSGRANVMVLNREWAGRWVVSFEYVGGWVVSE